jgi:hypothetical protein
MLNAHNARKIILITGIVIELKSKDLQGMAVVC